jgi:hypothetical protein
MTIQEIITKKKAIAKKNNKVEDKQKREKEQQDKEQKLSLDSTMKQVYLHQFDSFLSYLSGKKELQEWERRDLIGSFQNFIKALEVK